MSTAKENPKSQALELLAFRVGEHEYSVDIMSVREIRGWSPATPLPHAPHYVCGVINLRGAVLPIVDLSSRLGQEPIVAHARNVVIVVHVAKQTIGVLVDAVSDILTIDANEIQAPPDVAGTRNSTFISGLTVIEDRMVRILDLSDVLPETSKEAGIFSAFSSKISFCFFTSFLAL